MMKKIAAIIVSAVLLLSCCSCGGNASTYEADFSVKDGSAAANIKKFDNFTSTWPWCGDTTGSVSTTALSTVPALSEILAENLRFDLFMGYNGLGSQIGRGSGDGTTDAEHAQSMQLINKLIENEVNPYVVYFANPQFSQRPDAAVWSQVPDLSKWQQLCGNIASYYKKNGIRLGGHEIWNEPDFGTAFFMGSWLDYVDMYVAGAKGIRAADPDALIGGMSAAHIFDRVNKKTTVDGVQKTDFGRFIEGADAGGVMPDFVSWHYYGRDTQLSGREDPSENFDSYLLPIRNALNTYQDGSNEDAKKAYSALEITQQHLNEFNIYQPSADPVYMTEKMLPGMFYAFDRLLDATDVTRVMWASLLGERGQDLSYDLIDARSLQRYPAYHALWMYAHLPVDRVKIKINGDIGTMAGVDGNRAGLIVYNKTSKKQSINLKLKGIPFEKADLSVYLTDKDHFTHTTKNAPARVKRSENINPNGITLSLNLQPNSAYYIEANKAGESKSEVEQIAKVGTVARKDYWYPDRGDGLPYAELHENSMTAHLGMISSAEGKSACAVTLDGLKETETLSVKYETWGGISRSEKSSLGIKVDYQTAAGFVKSVFYTVKDFGYDQILPFGTKAAADEAISMGDDLNGNYTVALKEKAPEGWTGRVVISYVIKDAGKGAAAKFIIR